LISRCLSFIVSWQEISLAVPYAFL
jgi:hypothetical protein